MRILEEERVVWHVNDDFCKIIPLLMQSVQGQGFIKMEEQFYALIQMCMGKEIKEL